MLNQFSRTQLLIGQKGMERLFNARVAVFGIGGVGGYTVEALARSGIGTLDLIDDDRVCLTNLNRQLLATRKTVGQYKVDVAEQRIHEINPDAVVHTYKTFYAKDVIWVCSDMYRPFERSISFALPNASWAIDHFHVVMKANEAVDDVRRKLQSDMPKRERIKTKRGFAYTLKKRMDDLTEEEAEKIKLARRSEKTAPFAVAYDLKEDFFNIYDNNPSSKEAAQQAFAEWEASIPQDELYDKFRDLAKTVHNFYDQIFAYWDCPIAISNGFTECTNRLIRENNCRGRGYSFEVLKARTLFRRKNLDLMFQNDLVTQNFGPSIPENEPVFHFEGSKNDTSYDDDEDDDYEPFPEEDDIGVEEPED